MVDRSTVYVWDTNAMPHSAQNKRRQSSNGLPASCPEPTVQLIGHEAMAQFALDCSPQAPVVVSGGQDALVLLWSLSDVDHSGG